MPLRAAICLFLFSDRDKRHYDVSFAKAPLAMWNLFVFACHGGVCLNLCAIAHCASHIAACIIHRFKGHMCISCILLHCHFKQMQVKGAFWGSWSSAPFSSLLSPLNFLLLQTYKGFGVQADRVTSSPHVLTAGRGSCSLLRSCQDHTSLSKWDISMARSLACTA